MDIEREESENRPEMLPDFYWDRGSLDISPKLQQTMYPLSSFRAKTLVTLGLPVYEVVRNKAEVKTIPINVSSKLSMGKIYAIEKSVWNEFIRTEKGEVFIEYWNDISNKTEHILDEILVCEYNEIESKMRWDYYEETNACEWYLDDRFEERGDKERDYDVEAEFQYLHDIGMTLATEYAKKLFLMEYALDRKRADMLVGYARIMEKVFASFISDYERNLYGED